jgi:hypothetical protein
MDGQLQCIVLQAVADEDEEVYLCGVDHDVTQQLHNIEKEEEECRDNNAYCRVNTTQPQPRKRPLSVLAPYQYASNISQLSYSNQWKKQQRERQRAQHDKMTLNIVGNSSSLSTATATTSSPVTIFGLSFFKDVSQSSSSSSSTESNTYMIACTSRGEILIWSMQEELSKNNTTTTITTTNSPNQSFHSRVTYTRPTPWTLMEMIDNIDDDDDIEDPDVTMTPVVPVTTTTTTTKNVIPSFPLQESSLHSSNATKPADDNSNDKDRNHNLSQKQQYNRPILRLQFQYNETSKGDVNTTNSDPVALYQCQMIQSTTTPQSSYLVVSGDHGT